MNAKRKHGRMVWWKQVFPRTLYSIYRDGQGTRWFSIWRQWMGNAYDHRRFPIAEPFGSEFVRPGSPPGPAA